MCQRMATRVIGCSLVLVKILDRYLVREIIPPLLIGLAVLTFALILPPILQQGARLIEKGVQWGVILRVLWTLTPQALSITIPMSLLLGILVGLGRLSADREFVALQACGISVFRVLRPIVFLAGVVCAATAYETIIALPDANQTFRTITFNVVATRAESDIKPRVFFQEFPNRVLYVRDIQPASGWKDVFLADSTNPDQTTVYFARSGRLLIDRAKQTVQLLLEGGTRNTTYAKKPEEFEGDTFGTLVLNLDAQTVFPRAEVIKGDNEMTIAELRAKIAENAKTGDRSYSQLFTIQQKYSIPVACLVLSLIGVALGVSIRRDGKLGTIALGIGVIFVYYVLLYSSRAAALGGSLSPTLAPWIVNLLLGAAGVALVIWRAGAADQPIRIKVPTFWRRSPAPAGATPNGRPGRVVLVAVLLSGVLVVLQERVLADANREAARLNAIIRGWPVQTFGGLNRRWIVGSGGDLYYYEFFDPRANQFDRLSLYHLDQAGWKLDGLIHARKVALERRPGADGQPALMWIARDGWNRRFSTETRRDTVRTVAAYQPFFEHPVTLEPPTYFRETVDPEADRMTYRELQQYVSQLQASGYHAVPYMVQLHQKVAFPFVTLIMTLLAVPFAVTTGRRGAMSGIGVGIVLAIVYRTAMVVFAALGAGGWLSPMLGAWAPNIVFGAAAI